MSDICTRWAKEMKLARRQLRRLLEQEVAKLSDEEKAVAEKKIEDEGGALGKDDFVKAVNDVNPDVNYSEEEALRRAEASIENFKLPKFKVSRFPGSKKLNNWSEFKDLNLFFKKFFNRSGFKRINPFPWPL